MRVSSLVED
jgi:small GTP-binding protein